MLMYTQPLEDDRSRRPSSSYESHDDSGSHVSGVSLISEDIFQKTVDFTVPLDEKELFLKVQARVPRLCIEVVEAIKNAFQNKEIMEIMHNDQKLLDVINMATEHVYKHGKAKKQPKAEMVESMVDTANRYRVCRPQKSKSPVNNVANTPSPVQVQIQPNPAMVQAVPPQLNLQYPQVKQNAYYYPQQQQIVPQMYRVQQPNAQHMYKVTYPQYVYVAQPQFRQQYVYTAQPFRVAQQNVYPTNQTPQLNVYPTNPTPYRNIPQPQPQHRQIRRY